MDKFNFVRNGVTRLPPGFRFQPTDEELVFQYLKCKVFSCPLPASIIPEINVCKYDPWDLPGGSDEQDRYFFSYKEAKYRNGNRMNRTTNSGYWKATGSDKKISSSKKNDVAGIRKSLVFYQGKSQNGSRTDWVMHEYRLVSAENLQGIRFLSPCCIADSSLCSAMGCNNTKLKAEGEEVPAKIRPLLRRQYEELKKRRSVAKLQGNTLSQKKLLKDDVEDDESSDSLLGKDDKVVKSCPKPKEIESRKEEIVVRVSVEKLSKVVPLPDSEFETSEDEDRNGSTEQEKKDKDRVQEEMNVDDKDHGQEKVKDVDDKNHGPEEVKDVEDKDHEQEKVKDADDKVEVETEEGKNAEKVHEEVDEKNDDEDEDEDDDNGNDEFSRLVCPGSPSFKIYCQPQKNEGDEKSKDPLSPTPTPEPVPEPAPVHQKSPSTDSVQSAASGNSANSSENVECVESITKRKHKNRKFGAVKNLLNVKSCYHPSCTCTGGSDRSRLLAAKAVH